MWFKKPNLSYHPAKAEDAGALADLHKANFAHGWTSSDMASLILDPQIVTLVARDNKVQGFVMMRFAANEAEILTIAVHSSRRGEGIATRLLKEIWPILALKKVEDVFLEVAEKNLPALKLYTKLGFVQVGLRKSYYGQNENALILKRPLKISIK